MTPTKKKRKNSLTVQAVVDDELLLKLKAEAAADGRSVSQMAAYILRLHFREKEKANERRRT